MSKFLVNAVNNWKISKKCSFINPNKVFNKIVHNVFASQLLSIEIESSRVIIK